MAYTVLREQVGVLIGCEQAIEDVSHDIRRRLGALKDDFDIWYARIEEVYISMRLRYGRGYFRRIAIRFGGVEWHGWRS